MYLLFRIDLQWSAQVPTERTPSTNAVSKKSITAIAGSTEAPSSSSTSTPVFEKHPDDTFSIISSETKTPVAQFPTVLIEPCKSNTDC